MTLIRVAVVALALYGFSLAASAALTHAELADVLLMSFIIFAVAVLSFVAVLAVVLAILKKPEIEEGTYEMSRLTGKGET
jgi:NADH:ubiquinone oxidoreductase subunit 6 (subunit J)